MSHVDDEKTEAASFWSCLDDIQEGLEVSQSKIVHGTIFILQRFLSIHQAFFYGCRMCFCSASHYRGGSFCTSYKSAQLQQTMMPNTYQGCSC